MPGFSDYEKYDGLAWDWPNWSEKRKLPPRNCEKKRYGALTASTRRSTRSFTAWMMRRGRLPGDRFLKVPSPVCLTGQPAMSVSLHWSKEGLPCGVQFIARFGEESLLFQLGGQLERALPWFDKRPNI